MCAGRYTAVGFFRKANICSSVIIKTLNNLDGWRSLDTWSQTGQISLHVYRELSPLNNSIKRCWRTRLGDTGRRAPCLPGNGEFDFMHYLIILRCCVRSCVCSSIDSKLCGSGSCDTTGGSLLKDGSSGQPPMVIRRRNTAAIAMWKWQSFSLSRFPTILTFDQFGSHLVGCGTLPEWSHLRTRCDRMASVLNFKQALNSYVSLVSKT